MAETRNSLRTLPENSRVPSILVILITHFFDCGPLKGLVIAVIAGITYWVISLILSAIPVALGLPALPSLW